ncbi:MAG: ABC transporter permease [Cellulosilyticaceae bacterium]
MYFKLARNNVKKSLRDYTLYFLTLTFAVCIFYSFNAIESQQAMFELNGNQANYMEMLTQLIGWVSVFVSLILGGLIIYANNFLVKKRKKELGVYMTLGMGKNKISRILLFETFLIGIVALISGLGLGVVLSQGLSVVTANLFEVGMNKYQFIISGGAIVKTSLYFGLIFVVVMIFNTWIISKYQLIDLLYATKKNEEMRAKNPKLIIGIFMTSVIMIAIAYGFVIKAGLDAANILFQLSIAFGVLGTFLFFYSLAGCILSMLQRREKVYFKELNIFVLRQINSKINTNFISMSVICLMLVLTIGMLSTGLGFKSVIEKGLEAGTPFDASATMYNIKDEEVRSIEESFEKIGFGFELGEQYASYYEYKIGKTLRDILRQYTDYQPALGYDYDARAIKIADYNKILELQGRKTVELRSDEILISSNFGEYEDVVNVFLENENRIEINGKTYTIKNKKAVDDQFTTTGFRNNSLTLIVPDDMEGLEPMSSVININYAADKEKESEAIYTKLFESYRDGSIKYKEVGFVNGSTKMETYEMNIGTTSVILFIGIYMGIIFLLASAAVLGLQQLSEAGDSIERYKILKKIGVSEQMIRKTILMQVASYFILPLGLAFVHATVGIGVINSFLKNFGKPDIVVPSIITTLMLTIVYGGYFLATYSSYKNIIKNN